MRLHDYIITAAVILLLSASGPPELHAMDYARQADTQVASAGSGESRLFAASAQRAWPETSAELLTRRRTPVSRIEPVILGDIFERNGGHFHAFVSISDLFIDNVYRSKVNPVKDSLQKLTGGIWVAMPGIKQPLKDERISTTSLGGKQNNLLRQFSDNRYQIYLMYSMDLESYANNSFYSATYHNADLIFQLNFRGGLSIGIWDTFTRSHDERSATVPFTLDQYDGNRLNSVLSYNVTDKLTMRAAYANFDVNYIAPVNDYRDRADTIASAYLIYKFMPKTSIFMEYKAATIDYNLSNRIDSTETQYGGGFKWTISDKSKGAIRAGYSLRVYDDQSMPEAGKTFYDLHLTHAFTGKSTILIKLSADRRESPESIYDYIDAQNAKMIYWNKLTEKLTGFIGIDYLASDYAGDLTTPSRQDDRTTIWSTVEFAPLKWLSSEIGYKTETISSSQDINSYKASTVFLKVTSSF